MSIQKTSVDTIAAIATPPGYGGIGIIRISGPKAVSIAKVMVDKIPDPGCCIYQKFVGHAQQVMDQGMVLFYKKPHSYTGEDVIELQGHGSPVVLNSILNYIVKLGARLARPGEFTECAFLNGRLDLAQAEAVHSIIHAQHEKAAHAAIQSLQGVFSKRIGGIQTVLKSLISEVEASIDFSEEAMDVLQELKIEEKLSQLLTKVTDLKEAATLGEQIQRGRHLVIAGPPNVGKSSLLNALSLQNVAIVTSVAGTTRDTVSSQMHLDKLLVNVVDTAGLRDTQDEIEAEGIRRALVEIKRADQILWVVDSNQPFESQDPNILLPTLSALVPSDLPITVIRNKIDLTSQIPEITEEQPYHIIRLSAKKSIGMELLRSYLKNKLALTSNSVEFSARARHVLLLNQIEEDIKEGIDSWCGTHALEVLAIYLRRAQAMLSEITGESFTTEDVLGHIFAEFCIGK